jgi:hypothetical protein
MEAPDTRKAFTHQAAQDLQKLDAHAKAGHKVTDQATDSAPEHHQAHEDGEASDLGNEAPVNPPENLHYSDTAVHHLCSHILCARRHSVFYIRSTV